MATIKKVKVKRTVYNDNKNASDVEIYIENSVEMGSRCTLYQNPNIPTAFYTDGTNAAKAINDARVAYGQAETKGKLDDIADKVKLGKIWLDSYADKVEVIANDPANRTTREEASTNIYKSYLTPQKLTNTKKGNPATPEPKAKNIGTGLVDVEITNGDDYNPSQTTFIMVEVAANATINIDENQLIITMKNPGQCIVKTASKKGKFTHFTGLNSVQFAVYAYAQNGAKQWSLLSEPVFVRG